MSSRFGRALRGAAVLLAVPAAVAATAAPAGACGGLVGENGTIQARATTTLAAYHDGVERYVTSFEFTGRAGSRIDHAVARHPDQGRSAAATGHCNASQREVAPPIREGAFAAADQASSRRRAPR